LKFSANDQEVSMECTAKVVRERKEYGKFPGDPTKTYVLIYCSVMGEIVLSGEQAERALQKLREIRRGDDHKVLSVRGPGCTCGDHPRVL